MVGVVLYVALITQHSIVPSDWKKNIIFAVEL